MKFGCVNRRTPLISIANLCQGSLIPSGGLTKTYHLHIDVNEDTPGIILSQDIYISEISCKDNYRDSDPVNAGKFA